MDRTQFTREFNALCAVEGRLLNAAIEVEMMRGDKRRLTKADRKLLADIETLRSEVIERRDGLRRAGDHLR